MRVWRRSSGCVDVHTILREQRLVDTDVWVFMGCCSTNQLVPVGCVIDVSAGARGRGGPGPRGASRGIRIEADRAHIYQHDTDVDD